MSLTVMTLTTAAALAAMASFAEGSRAFWSPAAGAFLWMLTFSAASVVLLQTGNAMLAQFMGSLAAATGPAWILALWRRAPVLGGNAMPALVLTGGAILVSGHFYGELGLGELAIVAAAPLTSVAAASLASGLGRPVWTHLAGLTGAALPLAAAVWLTRSETPYP
jgi:hypothetical protein